MKYTKLLVGLGNPGLKYIKTRHNIGFMMIDHIALNFIKEQKFNSICYFNNNIIYIMPQTYMNKSGESVQKFCQFYKINSNDIIVIHDDIDLKLGQIKIKLGGSSGGHNGLKSIDEKIGNNYYRIRLGIGRSDYNASDYVLQKFQENELILVQQMIDFMSQNIDKLIMNTSISNINAILSRYSLNCKKNQIQI